MTQLKLIFGGILGAFLLLIALSSFYTVDQGERGVILRNGALVGTADPGLHWKVPVIDTVKFVDVRDGVRTYETVAAYSKDQQTATMRVTVNYQVPADRVGELYSEYGSVEAMLARVVDPKLYERIKMVFGQFNAVAAIQERARLGVDSQNAVVDVINGPVVISSIQIENIDFSDAYEHSIEQRMLAEVEVQKVRQNAEKEKVTAEITVTQAKAQADSQLAIATADAEAIKLRGNAEAEAIRVRAKALADNPALVELTKAERWNGTLPTTMMPGNAVPFLDVSPNPRS